ncbi:PhzF family phenazine biosynthesis protein [Saccharopolyspora sp. K220]|uniref:PhzF family phenazine biosynthesis protein n=1 Tax=Saccharopolyspora soli TaxID=2926618 RepID=UPI001F56480F|nr:PhzF family phenazine biosynthesis protein [Saccharopolyspora soli]MCI2419289.1 PhzF family phenazine biosynthesis protein [Saccharopolyspora soli]
MADMHVLRVFTNDNGGGGNPLGVFLHGDAIPADRRQEIATEVGFSETVFVDDLRQGKVQIFDPASEVPFAGHPRVGTAWLLSNQGISINRMHVSAGVVDCWAEGDETWVRGKPDWGPRWDLVGLNSPNDVDQLRNSPGGLIRAMAWAWENTEAGDVRARVFAMYCGVFEDAATGSAALRLAGYLGRDIVVRQGADNSLVRARVSERAGYCEVGGRTTIDEIRDIKV